MTKRTRLETLELMAEDLFDYIYTNTPENMHETIREFGRLRYEMGLLSKVVPEATNTKEGKQ